MEYYQQWFSLASKEINQLHGDLEELERQLNSSEETLLLKDELILLKNKVLMFYLNNLKLIKQLFILNLVNMYVCMYYFS